METKEIKKIFNENKNLAYYTYNDEEGILMFECDAEDYNIDTNSVSTLDNMCFVPFADFSDELADAIADGNYEPETAVLDDDCINRGAVIEVCEIPNPEDEMMLEDAWVTEDKAREEEARMDISIRTECSNYWESSRTRITKELIELGEDVDADCRSEWEDALGQMDEVAELREEWENLVDRYDTSDYDWSAPTFDELMYDAWCNDVD